MADGSRARWAAACVAWLLIPMALAVAALPDPRLFVVFPPGGRAGSEVEVTIEGEDLDDAGGLVFSHPGIVATPRPTPRKFEKRPDAFATRYAVKIAPDVPPGFHAVRVLGRFGLSSPRSFEVSDLPQFPESVDGGVDDKRPPDKRLADNHSFDKAIPLPFDTIVDGRTDGNTVDVYRFDAKAGQRLIVRCLTRSIDSRASPLVELITADGAQLKFSRGTSRREPVIDFTAPADGTYQVRVADISYRGGPHYTYRLVLSTRPFIEFLWPPVAAAGTKGTFTVFGRNLPGGTPVTDVKTGPQAGLERLDVEIQPPAALQSLGLSTAGTRRDPNEIDVQGFEYRLASPQGPSNPVFVSVTSLPIVVEQEPGNDDRAHPQPLTLPCEVAGRFHPERDVDWFSFEGRKGEQYAIEVFSERLTLPTDPSLRVEVTGPAATGAAGAQETVRTIAEQDDAPRRFVENRPFDVTSHDPAVLFTAESDGIYRIAVRDLTGVSLAHPRHVYRMVVQQAGGDFQLLATCREVAPHGDKGADVVPAGGNLRRGGTLLLTVQAYRHGVFSGPIALAAEGLPTGVTCRPVSIPSGGHQAGLVLTAAADAAAWQGPIRIVGTARIGDRDVRREAAFSTMVWPLKKFILTKIAPELIESPVFATTMLSVVADDAAFALAPAFDTPLEVAKGAKLDVRFKVSPRREIKGGLKVDLRGLPSDWFKQQPSATADGKAAEGTLSMTLPADAKPGDYAVYLVGQGKVTYARNPDAVPRATARKTEVAAEVARLTEEAKTDKAAAETLRAATEELKLVEKLVADVTAAAAPKDVESCVASEPFIVRVTEPPAPAKPAGTPAKP